MSVQYVVIAPNGDAYLKFCEEKGFDPEDRKTVIPLITFPDKYRLYGRNLSQAKLVAVGPVNPTYKQAFIQEFKNVKGK